MKIFFEDGKLKNYPPIHPAWNEAPNRYIIDATDGYSTNYLRLDGILLEDNEAAVYTNDTQAFDIFYAWNMKLEIPEIYIRDCGTWKRIDKLANRKLYFMEDLWELYIKGEFDND